MPLAIDIAIAKTNKYASRESGDTVEIVERPGGGMSVIMADGQGSGRAAKSLSMLVTAKVSALLKEGVRDGAAARAANDFLFAMRHGQVSATLDILSVDLKSRTVVITRNGDTICLVETGETTELFQVAERPLGTHARNRPWTAELPICPGTRVILASDGIANAGTRHGDGRLDLTAVSASLTSDATAPGIADRVLERALELDRAKPGDDMSVVALVLGEHEDFPVIRRMRALVPLP